MKILIAYYSKHGSTKKVADFLKKKFEDEGISVDAEKIQPLKEYSFFKWFLVRLFKGEVAIHSPKITDVSGYDAIVLGSPNWSKLSLPVAGYLNAVKGIEGKKIGIFFTTFLTPAFEWIMLSAFFLYRTAFKRIEAKEGKVIADLFLSGGLKKGSIESEYGVEKANDFCEELLAKPSVSGYREYAFKKRYQFLAFFTTVIFVFLLLFQLIAPLWNIDVLSGGAFIWAIAIIALSYVAILWGLSKKIFLISQILFSVTLTAFLTLMMFSLGIPFWMAEYFYLLALGFVSVSLQNVKTVLLMGVSIIAGYIYLDVRFFDDSDNFSERLVALLIAIFIVTLFTRSFERYFSELIKAQRELEVINVDLEERVQERTNDLEKFKLAVDDASDHIIITDPAGIVLYANEATEKITGYKVWEIMGTKAGSLWSYPMEKEYYDSLWRTIRDEKKVFSREIKNRRKNGKAYDAIISISPVLNASGDIIFFVGIERDITQMKEVDRAKSEFVSLASHQLRTPLTSINWYTEMLVSEDIGPLNAKQKKVIKEICDANERMVKLVSALLNVSRIETETLAIDPSIVDVTLTAKSIIKELRPQIRKKKVKVRAVYGRVPKINYDPKFLRVILQNLLSNAVKYTPEKGEITLEVAIEDDYPDSLIIRVSDNGYGIPSHQQDKIFTKLFRADNVKEKDTEGTGLGLYIVKSIVDGSGGKIWFESEENKGTAFYVLLPIEGMKKKEGTRTLI